MSGLFSRLAKQTVRQHHAEVMPINAPVFANDTSGGLVEENALCDIDSQYKAQTPQNEKHKSKPAVDIRPTENAQGDVRGDRADKQTLTEQSLTPLFEPWPKQKHFEVESHTKGDLTKQEYAGFTPMDVSLQGENMVERTTDQPQIDDQFEQEFTKQSWHAKKAKKSQQNSVHNSDVLLPQSSILNKTNERLSAGESQRLRAHSSGIMKIVTPPQETVVNVSIGKIEIKAIRSEAVAIAKKRQSNRKPSISLDQYQRNRQRANNE